MTKPVAFNWDGEAMIPLQRFNALCDRQFIVGERYTLVPHEDRSQASHGHYFAAVNSAWMNLPEMEAAQFQTSEHLRKWCLIKARFCDERSIVCASKAEAQRVGAFIKPMDDYAVVMVSEATVKVFTAQSQSMKAMGREAFQRSKQAVLDILADMVGVSPQTLSANAGRAA